MRRVLDLFSCVGAHHIGLARVGGFETVAFCEANPFRRDILSRQFPGIPIHDDVRTMPAVSADIVFGGPPCQATSVAAAVHGKRTGESLWPHMLRIGLASGAEWIVVEQPTGNAQWEAYVSDSLARAGRHVARLEFEARDVGAPYPRRRVFILSGTSLPRLEIAWREGPRAIERVARAADARGAWDPDQLEALPVDARSAGEHDGGAASRYRREMIEALGDSNPPGMAEVIGHCLTARIDTAIARAEGRSGIGGEAERLREAVRRAALEWCGEKERETFPEDIEYFEASWRHLPGLRARVEAILARPSPVPAACRPEGGR